MRIGISTSVIQRGRTGIGQYLFALLRAYLPRMERHSITLFVLEEDLPLFQFVEGAMNIVTVPERYRPAARNILWHQTLLPSLVREHELDVLHIPSYRRLLWRARCPLVATIHDLAPFHIAGKYDWKRMLYGRVVVRQLARMQDEIIAISENTAQDIRRHFKVRTDRLSVIHNGLEHDRFFPGDRNRARIVAAERHDLRQPFFLYVARLEHPGKNHVRLISAFNQFKARTGSRWQLALGGSDWHGAEVIKDAVRKSPFASDIQMLGFVPDQDLPDLYRAADTFIYPSLYEGFGMPPTEAMACGCPVIASTRGSLGEVVGDGAALVDPESVDSMAQQMSAVSEDEALRLRLRVAGLKQAAKFDWNRTATETLKVYERALARLESSRTASRGTHRAHNRRPGPSRC
jgi:glycosyltransferase involved in cell wall biosynthesis